MSTPISLTPEQAQALRETLRQFDEQNQKDENVFDPNKPPKEPYRHKEFPKMLYGHEGTRKGHVIKVNSAAEEEAALAKGYSNQPHPGHDYSRIDRNSMQAAEHDQPEEVNEEDEAEASTAVERAQKKAEKKKAEKAATEIKA